ncbi:MAG: proton-conducting transporter membrane subunit [Candidatus Promineifilaceae bacterium]|nr:proton-conducting transporter membrane subunit [Candidatus Promineifilaceae bacterium]
MDQQSLLVILPIIIPLLAAAAAILLRRRRSWQAGWTLSAMCLSLIASLLLMATIWQTDEPIAFQSGGWPAPFGISLVADLLAAVFVVMIQLVMATGIIYAIGSKDKVVSYPTFYPLFLTLATGLTGAVLTGDLFNLYVFAELLVISGTVLTAISDDALGTEAAYKYFYISLLASFFMLLAIGSLYAGYGTLNMAALAGEIAAEGVHPLLWPAMAFLMAAFMIKSAVFPFHFWQPDFHTAAPTAVSAMLSSVVVKLGVYGFLRMTTLLFVDQAPTLRLILIVLGVIGVIFGGLSAMGTHNVKRMLAYSTLAQVGFILIGVGWGTTLSIAAAIIFAFNHSVIKAAMLMLAGYVASHAAIKSAAFNIVTGVGKSLPAAGFLFFIGSLALAGIPPTNGFVSKMLFFESGIRAEGYLALLLVGLASIFTLVYTVRAFQRIWWEQPAVSDGASIKQAGSGDQLLAPAILVLIILVLGIWAGPLVALAQKSAAWLGDPAIYMDAVLK